MGEAEAAAFADCLAPWPTPSGRTHGTCETGTFAKVCFELAEAAAQVGRTGTPEAVQQAVEVLEEMCRRRYSILLQD